MPEERWLHSLFFFFSFIFFFKTKLFKNWSIKLLPDVVLIAAGQQSDSVTHIYTFFFSFSSIMVYLSIFNIFPFAIQ